MKKVSNMRVLLVSPALNLCGGIEKYLISYYRELHNQIDFTFVTHDATDKEYLEEITNNGDKVLNSANEVKEINKNEFSEFN